MAAVAVLSKTAHLRRTYHLFSTYTASRLTPHFSNEISKSPLHRPIPQSDFGSFSKLPRFLSTNNAAGGAPNIQTDSTLKETVSDKGKQSGDSNQSSEQGKSVRGGPISWLSFLLLIVTGAGVVFYYDQEKKRHIEGR